MRVLLDCDTLMDVATARKPFAGDSQAVLEWCERHRGCGFVAWHTIANLYYLLRPKRGDAMTRDYIRDLLVFVEVAATGTAEVKHAFSLAMSDFEDALQAAAAVHIGADYIVTRNLSDYATSPVRAILPATFIDSAPA